ncbi:MAG: ATP-binding protein [Clostridium sp.]|nr:ATP-binding protein [Clostridium sp.]
MVILDLIVTIFQSFFIAYSLKCCLQDKNNSKTVVLTLVVTILSADIIKSLFAFSSDYLISINNLILMSVIGVIYRDRIRQSLTAYSIVNIIISIFIIISSNCVLAIVRMFVPEEYINYELAIIVYIPQIILMLLLIKNMKIIKSIYRYIINENMELATIIICNLLIFIVLFYRLTLGEYNQFVKNTLQILFAVGLIFLIFYFQRIYNNSKKISALNDALEIKNNELRKIKHDYGAQISYLYGLVLMERYDDLKKSLKNIINTNQNTTDAVEVKISDEKLDGSESILGLALKPAIESGIHVILEEDYDIKSIKINDLELYRIISNIVNNAIKAMNGNGIITVKAYELMNKVIIEIENNGPKIPDQNIDSIFNAGFTTKNNKDNSHGYGLSIVKELVENNQGNITVKSTEENTVFKISFNML